MYVHTTYDMLFVSRELESILFIFVDNAAVDLDYLKPRPRSSMVAAAQLNQPPINPPPPCDVCQKARHPP